MRARRARSPIVAAQGVMRVKFTLPARSVLAALVTLGTGCSEQPIVYHHAGDEFTYQVSQPQALAECKAEALRDFHNSRDHNIFDALDIQTPIRICMAGKGYVTD
jgi:hypothetical protein